MGYRVRRVRGSVVFFSMIMRPQQPPPPQQAQEQHSQAPAAARAEGQRCRPKTAEERSAYLELKKMRAEGTLTGSERAAGDIAPYDFELDLRAC